MDIRYRNDANHNYMIIKKEKSPINVNHEKMVIRNNIEGLLKMNLHFIDDEVFYYYDIRSKQSLGRLYEGRYMTGTELTNFFRGMIKLFNELEQYLLPAEGIVFDPEYIYVDAETITPYFVFYPSGKKANRDPDIMLLAEFLIDHADKNDPLAGRLSYDYFESVTDGVISPASLISGPLVSENVMTRKKEDVFEKDTETPEYKSEEGFDYWETEEDMSELDYFLGNDAGEKKDKGLLKTAGICLGLIAASAVFYLILVFNPSLIPFLKFSEEQYMAAGCVIALLFGAALTAVIFIYNRRVTQQKETITQQKQESMERKSRNPDALKERQEFAQDMESGGTEEDERTTLLSFNSGRNSIPYLAGNEMGDMICLTIDRNPYIIGKKGNRVNGVLKNSSVSRIHASIRETNGRYFLTDMNSTNGTFINGRKLELNETAVLEDGDNIGFAGTVLVFRSGIGENNPIRTQNSCPAC